MDTEAKILGERAAKQKKGLSFLLFSVDSDLLTDSVEVLSELENTTHVKTLGSPWHLPDYTINVSSSLYPPSHPFMDS